MEPIVIEVSEEPGLTGLQEIVRRIKSLINPDPWAESAPIILRGTAKTLALVKLLRLNQVQGIQMEVISSASPPDPIMNT